MQELVSGAPLGTVSGSGSQDGHVSNSQGRSSGSYYGAGYPVSAISWIARDLQINDGCMLM